MSDGQISVKIIKDSISEFGDRITTFELEYHRYIHGELMTHRLFSRNAMSSRAVPIGKMIEQVRTNPAMPIHWGANQSGMQAEEECSNTVDFDWHFGEAKCRDIEDAWQESADRASDMAERMSAAGYHKQIVNRILEPFQRMKTIITATEYDNFFYLRCHKDAQPEIKALADIMKDLMEKSSPDVLKAGQWHIPYVESCEEGYYIKDPDNEGVSPLSLEEALKVSASCCAQVSYRLLDNSVDKAVKIYDKLIESKPAHSSPFEHQAKVMKAPKDCYGDDWEDGVTHMTGDLSFWSANFKGWIQHRHLIE